MSPARSITACLAHSSLPAADLARESAGAYLVALITICRSAAGSPPSPLGGRNAGLVRACPHRVAHPCLARAGRQPQTEENFPLDIRRSIVMREYAVATTCESAYSPSALAAFSRNREPSRM